MKTRRILSILMALLLAFSMPLSALADTYDLADGSISINAGENGQTVTQEENNIINHPDSDPVITQTVPEIDTSGNEVAPPTTNTITITVSDNETANVTLDGVDISAGGAAIEITGSGDVVIELDGDNTVQSGENCAGVEKNNDGSLTIKDDNGDGSLTATGGDYGAGIGGGDSGDGSNITINGGKVTATGGENAAGIGGGNGGEGSDITVSGGEVAATSGNGGAGIGGGDAGDGSNITINGGKVTATGGFGAAGIGGGDAGEGSNITVSGGDVTANGGFGGAGIGGGRINDAFDGGNGSNITISGGKVDATGLDGGAGIGGGIAGDGSSITISGGTVNADGGNNAAGIGGGVDGNGSDITISGGTVEATGGNGLKGNADAVESLPGGAAGIGGGTYGSGEAITIENDAVVTAQGQGNAANIGDGYSDEATEKQQDNVDVSGLYTTGSVNGVPGTVEPPKDDDNQQPGDDENTDDDGGRGPLTKLSMPHDEGMTSKSWSEIAAGLGGLTVSDNNGNDLSNVVWLSEESLDITTKESKVTVNGTQMLVISLTEQGVNRINLDTKRVNVNVSSALLEKTTKDGGSFQLTADDTTVSLTTTDQNNQKTLDLKLTANKQSGTQAAPDQNVKNQRSALIPSPIRTARTQGAPCR